MLDEGWWITEESDDLNPEPVKYTVSKIEGKAPVYCILYDQQHYWENAVRLAHDSLSEEAIEETIRRSQRNAVEAIFFSASPFRISFDITGQYLQDGELHDAIEKTDSPLVIDAEDVHQIEVEGNILYYTFLEYDFLDQEVSRLNKLETSAKVRIFEYDKRFEGAYDKDELINRSLWSEWVLSECLKKLSGLIG